MAEHSVAQRDNEDQTSRSVDWEEESYREGCAYACEQARLRLQALDDELLCLRPKGLRVEGFRERTVVTRFGDVVVRRRMYRDDEGNTLFALDEHLGWKPRQQATPSLTESVVATCKCGALSDGGRDGERPDGLSPMTVHRLLSGVAQSAMDDERSRWEACFERGEDMCDGQQQTDVLYTEADMDASATRRAHALRGQECHSVSRMAVCG